MRITIKPFLQELGRHRLSQLLGWRFVVLMLAIFTPSFSGVWDWLVWPIVLFIIAPRAMVVYALMIQSGVGVSWAVLAVFVVMMIFEPDDLPYGDITMAEIPARFRADVKRWLSLLIEPSPAV